MTITKGTQGKANTPSDTETSKDPGAAVAVVPFGKGHVELQRRKYSHVSALLEFLERLY